MLLKQGVSVVCLQNIATPPPKVVPFSFIPQISNTYLSKMEDLEFKISIDSARTLFDTERAPEQQPDSDWLMTRF